MAQMTESSIDLDWHALSEQEIRQFDEQGYLIVRNVLDQEMIDRIVEAGDRLIASDDREMRTGGGFKNCIVKDDAFIPLLTHSKSLSVVVQLLGAHIQLMVSHLVYKSPFRSLWQDSAAGLASRLWRSYKSVWRSCPPRFVEVRVLSQRYDPTKLGNDAGCAWHQSRRQTH